VVADFCGTKFHFYDKEQFMDPIKSKIFFDGGQIPADRLESVIAGLSQKLNTWLADHPSAEILNILQSESQGADRSWNITITIFYRES
jgi:hypothetical protein